MTPEAMSLFLAWMRCQAEVRDTNVRGPIDEEPRRAGIGSQGRLQHAITVQREAWILTALSWSLLTYSWSLWTYLLDLLTYLLD